MPTEEEKKEESRKILQELRQAVIGITDNAEDNGIIGDVKDIKEILTSQNKRIGKSEGKINKIWGILIGIGAVGGTGLGIGIKQILGN